MTVSLRRRVLELYDNTCTKCSSIDTPLIHHVDKDRGNNELNNLIVLCRACHIGLHYPQSKTTRITALIDEDLDKRLRDYINETYFIYHGKISRVVSEALTAFLDGKETQK